MAESGVRRTIAMMSMILGLMLLLLGVVLADDSQLPSHQPYFISSLPASLDLLIPKAAMAVIPGISKGASKEIPEIPNKLSKFPGLHNKLSTFPGLSKFPGLHKVPPPTEITKTGFINKANVGKIGSCLFMCNMMCSNPDESEKKEGEKRNQSMEKDS
jgi:hypothetical protein